MKPWTIPQFKKQLKTMDEKQLQQLLVETYKTSKEIKQLLNVFLREDDYEKELIGEYKMKIDKVFFPNNFRTDFSLTNAKALLKEGEKFCITQENLIDLQLSFVERGVDFTNAYGDISASFYDTLTRNFAKAVENILKDESDDLLKIFKRRCQTIRDNTSHIGWGFAFETEEIYSWIENEEVE